MLEEVGKRPWGDLRAAFSVSLVRSNPKHEAERAPMTLITTDDSAFPLNDSLNDIRDQLETLRADMAAMQARLKDGEITAVKDGQKTMTEIRQWLRIAIDLEIEFAKRQQKQDGIVGSYALDFDAARDRIRCRLDRLRSCRGTGRISE